MPPGAKLPFKPSILDKLLAGEGGGTDRAAARFPFYVPAVDRFTEAELQATVRRDVAWILNDIALEAAVPLDTYAEVRTSVLNYGVPELTGVTVTTSSLVQRADRVAAALRAFEERLRPEKLKVTFDNRETTSVNRINFRITGEIRNAVDESWIELKTTVDLDDGHVELV